MVWQMVYLSVYLTLFLCSCSYSILSYVYKTLKMPAHWCIYKLMFYIYLMKYLFTFTFMHLADAFIQSDLQLHSGYTFLLVHVFPGNRTHNLLCNWRNALPLSHRGTNILKFNISEYKAMLIKLLIYHINIYFIHICVFIYECIYINNKKYR